MKIIHLAAVLTVGIAGFASAFSAQAHGIWFAQRAKHVGVEACTDIADVA